MKHLITLAALLVSTAAVAQIPALPWNPDENGDQFIGLPDLLGLLTVYGQEFENAIVAEDGESAIMFIGYFMEYPLCAQACKNLPGIWQLPKIEDLGLVWDEVNSDSHTWLDLPKSQFSEGTFGGSLRQLAYYESTSGYIYSTGRAKDQKTCYCTAKQLPRVEYSFCLTTGDTYNDLNATGGGATVFQSCCDDKVENGWYPLGGLSKGDVNDVGQAFWRFAQ